MGKKGLSEEKRKQDCKTSAFKRLARKIKKAFPRLPIILLADSLYAWEPVMDTCRDNSWEFIIRYKTGSHWTCCGPGKGKSRTGESADGFPVADKHPYHQKERGKDSRSRTKDPTDRRTGRGTSPMPAAGMPQR